MNICIIHGNLGAVPEFKVTPGGLSILNMRVAVNERVKKGEEWTDHVEWFDVAVFGKRAESLSKILDKGSKVLVTGKVRTRSFEKEGVKHYRTGITADDVELGGRASGATDRPAAAPVTQQDDDNIPF